MAGKITEQELHSDVSTKLNDKTTVEKSTTNGNLKVNGSDINVYTHPNDANTRHVTDSEKANWNSKASTSIATTSSNGLMSSSDKSKLDGIEAGAQVNTVTSVNGKTGTVNLTFSDVGALSATGKAVDSDKLDGKDYTEFMTLVNLGANNQDPNTTTYGHIVTNHANTPNSSYYWHIQTYFYSSIGGNAMQIAVQYNSGNRMYVRSRYSGTWTAWAKVWTNLHDGSGSGLDADTWRGKSFLDVGFEYQAGNNIVIYSDYNGTRSSNTVYVEKKACIIGRDGTVRISFAMHTNSSSVTAYGRIYKNGVAVGTERSTTSTNPVVFTEDIAVSQNDRISLYLRSSISEGYVFIHDFVIRVNYDGSTYGVIS